MNKLSDQYKHFTAGLKQMGPEGLKRAYEYGKTHSFLLTGAIVDGGRC